MYIYIDICIYVSVYPHTQSLSMNSSQLRRPSNWCFGPPNFWDKKSASNLFQRMNLQQQQPQEMSKCPLPQAFDLVFFFLLEIGTWVDMEKIGVLEPGLWVLHSWPKNNRRWTRNWGFWLSGEAVLGIFPGELIIFNGMFLKRGRWFSNVDSSCFFFRCFFFRIHGFLKINLVLLFFSGWIKWMGFFGVLISDIVCLTSCWSFETAFKSNDSATAPCWLI